MQKIPSANNSGAQRPQQATAKRVAPAPQPATRTYGPAPKSTPAANPARKSIAPNPAMRQPARRIAAPGARVTPAQKPKANPSKLSALQTALKRLDARKKQMM